MDTLTGDLAAPLLGSLSGVLQVGKRLAVEPALAYLRHLILDARLVLWRVNARWVDEDAACLSVVQERGNQRPDP